MFISFLFFLKKKKETNQRKKKKQVRSYHENPRVTHSVCSDFGYIKYCRVAPATPQSRKFSDENGACGLFFEEKYQTIL